MCIGRDTENDKIEFDNLLLENSKEEVVLGVTFDNELTLMLTLKTYEEKLTKHLVHC